MRLQTWTHAYVIVDSRPNAVCLQNTKKDGPLMWVKVDLDGTAAAALIGKKVINTEEFVIVEDADVSGVQTT